MRAPHPHHASRRPFPGSRLLLLGATLALSACASTPDDRSLADELGEPYVAPDDTDKDLSLGAYLNELSQALTAWTNLVANASTPQDRDKVPLLTARLTARSNLRFEDLVDQLTVGPPVNREIAAAALGFSEREEALAPLVAALEDTSDAVVRNALLGLSQLRDERTPLMPILDALRFSNSDEVRSNAALTVKILIADVGVEHNAEEVGRVAMGGLTDPDPNVRTQSALILAAVERVDSIRTLGALLSDEIPLVASAAARALAYIGSRQTAYAGECARQMTQALPGAKSISRDRLLFNLRQLRNSISDGLVTFEEDKPEEWIKWSQGLP